MIIQRTLTILVLRTRPETTDYMETELTASPLKSMLVNEIEPVIVRLLNGFSVLLSYLDYGHLVQLTQMTIQL